MAAITLSEPVGLDDATAIAEEAGLAYVTDAMPGIRRRRHGKGFAYRDADGRAVSDSTRRRIAELVIPPAWSDVWICPRANGHLQATGRDARGRKQYRYHDRWRAVRDADKFSRLYDFGVQLPDLRAHVEHDLAGTGPTRHRVLALVVRLLDETLIRVGNEEYATTNESYGLTTLKPEHVDISSRAFTLEFVGKGGTEHDVTIDDARLARLVGHCHELGGQELFAYRDPDGEIGSVDSGDVNAWLHDVAGPDTSAKTFRTWGATTAVVNELAPAEPAPSDRDANERIVAAIDTAAAMLRNTRAVCRQSYVHPAVLDAYREGSLQEHWQGSRSSTRMSRGERTVLRVLDDAGT